MADKRIFSHEEGYTEVVMADNSENTHIYAIISEIVTLRVYDLKSLWLKLIAKRWLIQSLSHSRTVR